MRRSGKTMWKRQFYLSQDRLSFLYADNQKVQVWSLALPSLSGKKAFYYYFFCVSLSGPNDFDASNIRYKGPLEVMGPENRDFFWAAKWQRAI
jgi:hypothetical protein